MMAAVTDGESRDTGVRASSKLVEWGHGEAVDDWFLAELGLRPVQAEFRLPRGKKMLRTLSRSNEGFTTGAVIGPLALIIHGSRELIRRL